MEIMQKLKKVLEYYNIQEDIKALEEQEALSNYVWKATLKTGVSLIIKQYRNTSQARILQIHRIINFLKGKNFSIPKVIENNLGNSITSFNDEVFEVNEFIDHRKLTFFSTNLITIEDLNTLGNILGLLHKENPSQEELPKLDLEGVNKTIRDNIEVFNKNYTFVKDLKQELDPKIILIKKFLETTELKRSMQIKTIQNIHYESNVLAHGDFSLVNILPEVNTDKIYIIDWEKVSYSNRIFDLQKSIGYLCGVKNKNAYLVELDFDKVQSFLKGYSRHCIITEEDIRRLVTVADYFATTYWLNFTLRQTNQGDYRILSLVPDSLEELLYWQTSLETYRNLLLRFANKG